MHLITNNSFLKNEKMNIIINKEKRMAEYTNTKGKIMLA